MKLDKYKHYSIEDFALDPHFKERVLQPFEEGSTFFDNLIAHYPEKREEILQARKLVLQLDRHFHQQLPTIEEKATVYREIRLSLESWTQVGSRKLEVGIKPGKTTALQLLDYQDCPTLDG